MSRPVKRLLMWAVIAGVVAAAGVGLVFAVQRVRDAAGHLTDT